MLDSPLVAVTSLAPRNTDDNQQQTDASVKLVGANLACFATSLVPLARHRIDFLRVQQCYWASLLNIIFYAPMQVYIRTVKTYRLILHLWGFACERPSAFLFYFFINPTINPTYMYFPTR